jgi:uncharacterized radical SAM superfamily protein
MRKDAAGSELTVFSPDRTFPAVSVTGEACDLMCEHCKGTHLKGMLNASGADGRISENLFRIVDGILSSGGEGMLVSGGCDASGRVPVIDAIDAIRYAAGNGLKVNVHTGFITKGDAERLVKAGVNTFSADVHQDPAVIRDILHLDVRPDAYSDMLDNIVSAGGKAAVHLTAGFGEKDLRLSAELIGGKGFKEVVLLVLVPPRGTTADNAPVSADTAAGAVRMLAGMGIEVTLGCMRPRVCRDLEVRCIEAGVRRIANPSRNTLAWAKDSGMRIIEKRTCCCITH